MDSSEEEEKRMEEDKEVEKIFKKGQEAKRKILTGMLNMSDEDKKSAQVFLILNLCICQTCRTNDFFACSG